MFPLASVLSRLSAAAVAGAAGVVSAAQISPGPVQVPVVQILAEAEGCLERRADAEAARLLDRALARIEKGEPPPAGAVPDRLRLVAALAHLRSGAFLAAEEAAAKAEQSRLLPEPARMEARWVRGLALALQGRAGDAVPVFGQLVEASAFRLRALRAQALAARQAGDAATAIRASRRLLADGVPDAEAADTLLSLIELLVETGELTEAARGLERLAALADVNENPAAGALLALRLGDALLQADDAGGALAAYRSVESRDALLARHRGLAAAREMQLTRLRALTRAGANEIESAGRIERRHAQAAAAAREVESRPHFDALLLERQAKAYETRGGVWEAALLWERLLGRHPQAPEAEAALAGRVTALAESGRAGKAVAEAETLARRYPQSKVAVPAFARAAQAAGERADTASQLRLLELALDRDPEPPAREVLALLRANALFAAGRPAEAREAAAEHLRLHPGGRFAEEAGYLEAMTGFVLGVSAETLAAVERHLEQYPGGRFVADARYRRAAGLFALERTEEAGGAAEEWLRTFPEDHPQRGEVLSLQGDIRARSGDAAGAIASFAEALRHPLADEGLGYAMDELTRLHLARGERAEAVARWEELRERMPDHPFATNAVAWIARIHLKGGDREAARRALVPAARRHLADVRREEVEALLVELAGILAKPGAAGERPEESGAAVDWLLDARLRESPTARARARFLDAEIAIRRGRSAEAATLWESLVRETDPEALPAGLLARAGEHLAGAGDTEKAAQLFGALVGRSPRSPFADAAYVGLGDRALREGNASEALEHFDAAIDRAGARFRLREATLGRARSLIALGRDDEARAVLEQVASNRAWRGEATAESLFRLGELAARRGGAESLVQARGHFQRVYLGYRRFGDWAARAGLRSAEIALQLGRRDEAVAGLRELADDRRLAGFPAAAEARRRLERLQRGET